MKRYAGQDVDVANEDTFTLLKRGQEVTTPVGPGKIVDIEVQAGRYGERVELEPPVVTVKLDHPDSETPNEVVVCICKLGLSDKEHEALIKKEFARLWPPITDDIPEDTRMLVDVEEEFQKKSSEFRERIATLGPGAKFEPEDMIEAINEYVKLAQYLPEMQSVVAELSPGMVLRDLEGIDLGGESAVVVKTEPSGSSVHVVLYLPKSDKVKLVKVPLDTKFNGKDAGEGIGAVPTVYDPLRLESPEIDPIRILPDSYLRPDPNYPSSITNTVWRPTMRTTPVRFYNTKQAGIPFKPENDPTKERHWPPEDYTNYPTPDFVPHKDHMPEYITGVDLYEYDETRRHPDRRQDLVKENKKLQELADRFWKEYQASQRNDVHLRYDVHDFADMFAEANSMKEEEMMDLIAYMYAIGYFQKSTMDQYIDHIMTKHTVLNTRTHFHSK